MRLSNSILKPIISEKGVMFSSQNKYEFSVNMKASKGSITNELKNIFNVDVIKVWTNIVPGKRRRIIGTRKFTKTPSWKRAVVELKKGQKISLFPKE